MTYNLLEREGEQLMPKYWAVAAGESDVYIKNALMVTVESLECHAPYSTQKIGGTFRCVLECHPECSDLGCHRPKDNTACLIGFEYEFLISYHYVSKY